MSETEISKEARECAAAIMDCVKMDGFECGLVANEGEAELIAQQAIDRAKEPHLIELNIIRQTLLAAISNDRPTELSTVDALNLFMRLRAEELSRLKEENARYADTLREIYNDAESLCGAKERARMTLEEPK